MFPSFAWLRGKIFLKNKPGALFVVIGGIIAASVLAEKSDCDMPSLMRKPRPIPAAECAVASRETGILSVPFGRQRKSAFRDALGCRSKGQYRLSLPRAT